MSITIHNEYEDSDGNLILSSVLLEGCFYIKDESVNISQDVTGNADVVFVIIPYEAINGVDKTLVDSFTFDRMSDEEKTKAFKIAYGDFISFGDATGVESSSLSEYRNITGNAYEISAVADYNMGGLKHYEVSAH